MPTKQIRSSGAFWKKVLLYSLLLSGLTALLKYFEYRMFVKELSFEVYAGLIALLFTVLGIWVGKNLLDQKSDAPAVELDQDMIQELGLTSREYEVLGLMAKGMSNQEIADTLFISIPTVKTHSSNLFVKLDVRRRTQAVHRAKELNIIS